MKQSACFFKRINIAETSLIHVSLPPPVRRRPTRRSCFSSSCCAHVTRPEIGRRCAVRTWLLLQRTGKRPISGPLKQTAKAGGTKRRDFGPESERRRQLSKRETVQAKSGTENRSLASVSVPYVPSSFLETPLAVLVVGLLSLHLFFSTRAHHVYFFRIRNVGVDPR